MTIYVDINAPAAGDGSAGNVYLGGARSWEKEADKLVSDRQVKVELTEKDGGYCLKTDLFEAIGSFRGGIVSTDSLGKAFEPDQPFENPDGSPITFDTDYNGRRRTAGVLPGPFAEASEEIRVL